MSDHAVADIIPALLRRARPQWENPQNWQSTKNGLEHCVCQKNDFTKKIAIAQIVVITKENIATTN